MIILLVTTGSLFHAINPVVFVGQQTEVQVKLSWQDAQNKRIQIKLLDSVNMKTVLSLGQIIRVGTPGETLKLIACMDLPADET